MTKNLLIIILLLGLGCTYVAKAQSSASDSIIIKKIYNEALKSTESYTNLQYLCKHIGGRLTGSPQAAAAVEFTKQVMNNMNLDTV